MFAGLVVEGAGELDYCSAAGCYYEWVQLVVGVWAVVGLECGFCWGSRCVVWVEGTWAGE